MQGAKWMMYVHTYILIMRAYVQCRVTMIRYVFHLAIYFDRWLVKWSFRNNNKIDNKRRSFSRHSTNRLPQTTAFRTSSQRHNYGNYSALPRRYSPCVVCFLGA